MRHGNITVMVIGAHRVVFNVSSIHYAGFPVDSATLNHSRFDVRTFLGLAAEREFSEFFQAQGDETHYPVDNGSVVSVEMRNRWGPARGRTFEIHPPLGVTRLSADFPFCVVPHGGVNGWNIINATNFSTSGRLT